MPKFEAGDKVVVDGKTVVIKSWPHNDDGIFAYAEIMPDGGENWGYRHVGDPNTTVEPVHVSVAAADLVLVEAGEPVASTLTDTDLAVLVAGGATDDHGMWEAADLIGGATDAAEATPKDAPETVEPAPLPAEPSKVAAVVELAPKPAKKAAKKAAPRKAAA